MVMTKSLWLIGDFSRKKNWRVFSRFWRKLLIQLYFVTSGSWEVEKPTCGTFWRGTWWNTEKIAIIRFCIHETKMAFAPPPPPEGYTFSSAPRELNIKLPQKPGIWWKTNFLERFWFPNIWTVDFIKFNHSIFNKDQNWTRTRNFRNGSQQESWCKTKTFWKSLAVRESPIETWKFLTFSAFTVV